MATKRSSARGAKPTSAAPTTPTPTAGVAQSVEQRPRKSKVPGSSPGAGTKPINARQRAFVAEYLKVRNATEAYMRAYEAIRANADTSGARLLADTRIRSEIDRADAEVLAAVQADTGITLERTLREIAKNAFHDPRKFFNEDGTLKAITTLDDDTASALAGFEANEIKADEGVVIGHTKKVKLADRGKYLDMLMKHLGGYKVDNEQKQPALAEQLGALLGSLHSTATGRLPIAPRKPRA